MPPPLGGDHVVVTTGRLRRAAPSVPGGAAGKCGWIAHAAVGTPVDLLHRDAAALREQPEVRQVGAGAPARTSTFHGTRRSSTRVVSADPGFDQV